MGPVGVIRESEIALAGHLQEQQIGELFDVVAVADAVVAQCVTKTPEPGDDVNHAATSRFRSATRSPSFPSNTRLARPQPPRFERTGMLSKSSFSIERLAMRCCRM